MRHLVSNKRFSPTSTFWRLGAIGLSLLLAASVPACSSNEEADDSESGGDALSLSAAIRFARLKESIVPALRALIKDPTEVGRTVDAAMRDTDITEFVTLAEKPEIRLIQRAVRGMGRNAESRGIMVRSSLQSINRRSNALKALLEPSAGLSEALPNKANVADDLVIGMGPQSVAYAQAMTDRDPLKRIFVVEQGEKPGGTFANVNEAFALNSTNRASDGTRAVPGKGDLNFIMDIWGLPNFRGQKWAPAGGLAELSTVGIDQSSASPLLNVRVERVTERTSLEEGRKWGARYKVELVDTAGSGKKYTVFTNKVVVASGIGTPTIPVRDPGTMGLLDTERQIAASDPTYAQKLATFTEAINQIGQSDTPYRAYVNKDVAVIGAGDSGKVLNEFLFRDAPDGAYGLDKADVGNVRKVYWYGVDFQFCKEFIEQSRGRYSRLQSALNSGLLVPVPIKVDRIYKNGNRYVAETKFGVDLTGQAGVAVENGKIGFVFDSDGVVIKADKEMTGVEVGVSSEEKNRFPRVKGNIERQPNGELAFVVRNDVDYSLFATGFKSEAEAVFKPILGDAPSPSVAGSAAASLGSGAARQPSPPPSGLADFLEDVSADGEGFEGTTTVATRLKPSVAQVGQAPPQEIYFIGPSNEIRGGLPKPAELAGVNANTVSLFANVARTRAFAALNSVREIGLPSIDELLGVKKVSLARAREPGAVTLQFAADGAGASVKTLPASADLEVKALIAKAMARYDLPEGVTVTLTVKMAKKDGVDVLEVAVDQLDQESGYVLANQLLTRDDGGRLRQMFLGYFSKNSGVKRLEVVIPTWKETSTVAKDTGIDIVRRTN